MREVFKEYLMFIFISLVSILVIALFMFVLFPTGTTIESPAQSIFNESHLQDAMNDETINQGVGNENNEYGYYEKIKETNVYFNVVGQILPYGTEYAGTDNNGWKKYIKFKDDNDPEGYLNADGTENLENNHCLAVIKYHNTKTGTVETKEIDLTSYVTPANYTAESPIPSFNYINETPKEYEAQIEIVPYILNWENIHIKKNVGYYVLPKDTLLSFSGKVVNQSGTAFANKRLTFYKGGKLMAQTYTNANGQFLIGFTGSGTKTENNTEIMPIGEYRFVVESEGKSYGITFPENKFDIDKGQSTSINLSTMKMTEGA